MTINYEDEQLSNKSLWIRSNYPGDEDKATIGNKTNASTNISKREGNMSNSNSMATTFNSANINKARHR